MKRFMLFVSVLLFALSGMVQPTFAGDKDNGQDDPLLKGPNVVRHDKTKLPHLKNSKTLGVR